MKKKMKKTLLIAFVLFYILSGSVAAQDILRIDEAKSYVIDMHTGSKIPYSDFIDSEQLEGHYLEFHIAIEKTDNPISDEYVLELRTNLEDPEWLYGQDNYTSATVITWKGEAEHALTPPTIILAGTVPEAVIQVREPNFESVDLTGIGKKRVYVTLTIGTTTDGSTLKRVVQKLVPSMEFYATSEALDDAGEEMEANLASASETIGESELESNIRRLYEEGHPGWALILSEDYKALSEDIAPPPVLLYVILAIVLGIIVGGGFVYALKGKEGGVDMAALASELKEVSSTIEDTSRSINTIATKLARIEGSEERDAGRELMKMRGRLNESANQIRSVGDRLREE
ncbi:MAG: hypothetical protein ACXQS6_05075 [Candidatus Syntropharchaeales archaeon]